MPAWLGWLIGFSPLAGLLLFWIAEWRRLARLRNPD
jgi:hypothetical protein